MFMLFFVEVSFFEFILKKAVTNNYLNYFSVDRLLISILMNSFV
jgi:hypothetical protein